jgi:transcription initiation factor TFIIIB Brf1 subunit/transcription initiation factor TFIIB
MQSLIQCETCNPSESKLITDVESGEIICNRCGIVVERDLEDSQKLWYKAEADSSDTKMEVPLL